MTQREYKKEYKREYKKEHNRATTATDLEATQVVSWDDLQELEQLQFARAAAAEPTKRHRTFVLLGSALSLILAATLLLTALLMRSGGH